MKRVIEVLACIVLLPLAAIIAIIDGIERTWDAEAILRGKP